MDQDEFLSTSEAAEATEVSLGLIGRYCRDGRLKAQKVGGRWLIKRSDLEAFIGEPRPVGRPKQPKEGEVSDE